MAKLNVAEMKEALYGKKYELACKIQEMKDNADLSEATVRTQTHLKSHEMHNLSIMYEILSNCGSEISIGEDEAKWFASIVTLTEDRKKGSIIFREGDDFLEVLDAHPNSNYTKAKKALENQGFKLVGSTVTRA